MRGPTLAKDRGGPRRGEAVQWRPSLHQSGLCPDPGRAEGRAGRGLQGQGGGEPLLGRRQDQEGEHRPDRQRRQFRQGQITGSTTRSPKARRSPWAVNWKRADLTISPHPAHGRDAGHEYPAGGDLRTGSARHDYDDLDQAITHVASRDKPLALYIYSNDEAHVQKDTEPDLVRRRHRQWRVLALSGNPASLRRRSTRADGQLPRLFRLQGLLARARGLSAPIGPAESGQRVCHQRRVLNGRSPSCRTLTPTGASSAAGSPYFPVSSFSSAAWP